MGKSRTPSTNYPKKRTVIEFDVSSISSSANVINSQMKLYYYAAVRPTGSTDPWIDRWIQAHQLLVDWDEAQADTTYRLTSTQWDSSYGNIADGTDAKAQQESSVLFQQSEAPSWKSWNLTNVTQDWVDGSATNYGVILWATNEDTDGYEMRFRSSEYSSDQPKLEVTYTTDPLKTVFFLKDHLGSIRRVVDDTAGVVGYDDYDPWGYILAGRSSATAWSGGQNVAKNKFTGKEWDDDFGVDLYHFDWRRYDPEIGMWRSIDPMQEKFLGWSPYNYTLNNPVNNLDPDGMEVRFSSEDSTNAATIAELLNNRFEGANIQVVKRTGTDKEGQEITYFALEVSPFSSFDFGQSTLTLGLYDVIESRETVFDAVVQLGGDVPGVGDIQELGGGFIDPFKEGGGATVYLDIRGDLNPDQDQVISDVGVVFMHEAIGHGHPFWGNRQAVEINAMFSPFNPPPAHGGYRERVRWKGLVALWFASHPLIRK